MAFPNVSESFHGGGLGSGGGSGGEIVELQVGDDVVPAGAGLFEVVGFEGNAHALRFAFGVGDGEIHPPAAVVVPEVVVWVVVGLAHVEEEAGWGLGVGHAVQDISVFKTPWVIKLPGRLDLKDAER